MILALMRRDIAWKAVPYAISASFAGALMFGSHPIPAVFSSTFFIFIGAFVTLAQQARTSFLTPLPIKVSDIYAARVLSVGALIWFSVASGAPWIRGIETPALAAMVTLAILILQSLGVGSRRFSEWGFVVAVPLLFSGDALRIVHPNWIAGSRGGWIVALCLAASAILFLWRWSTVPEAAEIVPRTRRGVAMPKRDFDAATEVSRPWPLLRLYGWRYAVWLFVGSLQSVGGGFLGMFGFVFAILAPEENNRWLFGLPVSRRRLLPFYVAPLLVAELAGAVLYARLNPPRALELKREGCAVPDVSMSLRFWKQTGTGRSDIVRAPWGETFEPPLKSLAGVRAWNPYATGCGNSMRFYRWQLARAREAVLGARLDWRETFLVCAILAFCGSLALCASLFASWWRAQRWLGRGRMAPLFAVLLIWLVGARLPFWPRTAMWTYENAVALAGWLLPGQWVLLAAIPAALLYLAAEKFFREAESVSEKGTLAPG